VIVGAGLGAMVLGIGVEVAGGVRGNWIDDCPQPTAGVAAINAKTANLATQKRTSTPLAIRARRNDSFPAVG
jgi:hypothetical protein